MFLIYPAIFHKEDNSYWVEFPDLEGCHSFGDTLDETLKNAREALEGYCLTLLESGNKPNLPSDIQTLKTDENSFATLVDCKLNNTKQRSIKKTLTIPYWLNDMAVKEDINFSAVLQNALKSELHISE